MVKAVTPGKGTQSVTQRVQRDGAAPAAAAPTATDRLEATPETVTVKQGDTLSALASKHGMTVAQLKQLNPALFQDGKDSQGHQRGADGRLIYANDVIRLRPAISTQAAAPAPEVPAGPPAPPAPVAPQNTGAALDKAVTAAKAYIDAAGQSTDRGVYQQAAEMLSLIPATDPDRAAYEAKVNAIPGRSAAPAFDGPVELQSSSEGFNDASAAYDSASNDAGKTAARAQAFVAYQRAAQAVQALTAGEAKDVGLAQLDQMEMRLKSLGASAATVSTSRQAAGLPASGSRDGAGAAAGGIDPKAQEAFATAQGKFDEASEGYDKAVKSSKSLAEAAAAIAANQGKALAAYKEAVTAAGGVGPSVNEVLSAMEARLKQMGVSPKQMTDARAAAPKWVPTIPTAGGPTATGGTPLPVGPLPAGRPMTPAATGPAPTPQAPMPTNAPDQFNMQRQLFQKAIEDHVNSKSNGDEVGAENARVRAKAAYTAAAKIVGTMDTNTKTSYNKMLDDFEEKLQYYKVATINEMDPIRKEAKLVVSASTAWADSNRKDGAAPTAAPKAADMSPASMSTYSAKADEPKTDDEKKVRAQLDQLVPKMNSGQITELPVTAIKAASHAQRGSMLKELLDHWWVGGDKKKYAVDMIEIAAGEGKLDGTLRAMDQANGGDGLKLLFKKIEGDERQRLVKDIFWDLKDMNPVGSDLLARTAQHMDKDGVRAVLKEYGSTASSDWFKRLPPEVKAQFAKTLNGGWFGHSSEDKAMIQSLEAK